MTDYQKEVLDIINKLNLKYKENYKNDILILLHKFLTDTLTVDDFQDVCYSKGIDDILEDYYELVSKFEDLDEEDI